jgi:hypothetical protein
LYFCANIYGRERKYDGKGENGDVWKDMGKEIKGKR